MKKMISLILMITMLGSCMYKAPEAKETKASAPERLKQLKSSSVISVYNEFDGGAKAETSQEAPVKAVWLSYIDLSPMLENADERGFRENFDEACDNIASLGLDTIFVHVRPFGDALYDSRLFPKSVYYSGGFDPLKIMCDSAHSHGISIHAWINPLRLQSEDILGNTDESYITARWYREDSGMVKSVKDSPFTWLDPSYPEVRALIAEGAAEIVENYDIDGIHYDDYFYPTTDESFDSQCFAEVGEDISLSSWRLDNISSMCREIYSAVKAVDDDIVVSISPQGNIENNYAYMYADVKKWLAEDDICDIIIPQIYFGYDDPVKPFEETLAEWVKLKNNKNVMLMVGLAPYKIGTSDEFTDNTGIIASQIEDCSAIPEVGGVALFSYSSLFSADDERINDEKECIRDSLNSLK